MSRQMPPMMANRTWKKARRETPVDVNNSRNPNKGPTTATSIKARRPEANTTKVPNNKANHLRPRLATWSQHERGAIRLVATKGRRKKSDEIGR